MDLTYDRLRDHFLISDPGLFRLRAAIRGTITVLLSSAVLFYLSFYGHRPFLLALVGALMAMTGAFSADDRTIRAQKVTALWLPFVAAVSVAIGTFVLPWRAVAIVILLLFTFIAIDIRKYGPRWTTLGGIGYSSYFAALFFKVPPDQMWFVIIGIFVSGAFSYVVKFWIVPDRAQSAIAWSLSAYRAGLRRFVRAAQRELQTSVTLKLDREHLRARMVRVNELALLSEDAIMNASDAMPGSAALVRALQGRVFDLELSARRIFESLETRSREQTANDLALLEKGYRTLKANEAALIAEEDVSVPVVSASPQVAVATGLAKLRYSPLGQRLHFQTRQAVQATLATAIATLIGSAISTDRWYWAPLTAYVVFTGTTRGDSVRRAFHRLLGTASGVAAGLVLAYALHGERQWELAVLFISMFFAIFSIKASYAWYVFWLTTVIALFYSLLGLLTPELLYLRIEQTLIGGICGGACAFLVLPVSSKQSLRSEVAKLFAMLSDQLYDLTAVHLPRRERRVRVRALERELLTLRAIAGPLRGPLGRPVREETRIVVHGAAALVHFARQLIVFFPEDGTDMRMNAQALAKRASSLAERIPSTEFVDINEAMTGGARGDTWALDNPADQEAANYSLTRLAQSISAFETRFPPTS